MPILALTTSGPSGAVAVRHADGRVVAAELISGRTRGRDVAPRIAELLADEGIAPGALEAIAVDVGPGSFTGVRVGVTTAKTLAYALGCRVVAATSLEILAAEAGPDEPVFALRDAGRGLVYVQRFADGAPTHAAVRVDAEAARALQDGATPIGEDAPALAERLGLTDHARTVVAGPEGLLEIARARLDAGETTEAHGLAPVYLQASAPEERRSGLRDD